LCWDW